MDMTSSTSSSISMTGGVREVGGGVTCRAAEGVGLEGIDIQVGTAKGTISEAELEATTSPPEAA